MIAIALTGLFTQGCEGLDCIQQYAQNNTRHKGRIFRDRVPKVLHWLEQIAVLNKVV